VQPFGATIVYGNAVNFSIFSKDAVSCELLLYHQGDENPFAVIPFPDEFCIGNVFSMIVYDLDYEDLEYGYRMDGPFDPKNGYWFDKTKILLDPYAKMISGRDTWGEELDLKRDFQYRGKVIPDDYDWEGDKPLEIPMNDLVIYETHVRGFTKDESSNVKYAGTFAGILEKIPYLKELGINCIELLPIFEFDEFENSRVIDRKRLFNYWGYSSGIEIILDIVFNHTAEGNEMGPYISYRGIDNKTYYLLTPEEYYYNFSGCGNTMNCNRV
jgi:glycogen operon protein